MTDPEPYSQCPCSLDNSTLNLFSPDAVGVSLSITDPLKTNFKPFYQDYITENDKALKKI